MKRFIYIMCGLFVSAIAVTVAIRMTPDAMAVIIGIILGMVATIPTTLILLYTIRHRDNQQLDPRQQRQGYGQYPPVVVVNSTPNQGGYAPGMDSLNRAILPAPAGERSFKVVGQEASSDVSNDSFSFSSLWDDEN